MSEQGLIRRALYAAWGALRELSPCEAPECKQIQTETLADAIKRVEEALAAFKSFPSTDAVPAPSEAVAWVPVSKRLPDLHQSVALLNVSRWENCSFDRNVHQCGYLEDYGSGPFWSVYGERGVMLDAHTHWTSLPAAPSAGTPEEKP